MNESIRPELHLFLSGCHPRAPGLWLFLGIPAPEPRLAYDHLFSYHLFRRIQIEQLLSRQPEVEDDQLEDDMLLTEFTMFCHMFTLSSAVGARRAIPVLLWSSSIPSMMFGILEEL